MRWAEISKMFLKTKQVVENKDLSNANGIYGSDTRDGKYMSFQSSEFDNRRGKEDL
jgi:hypothetical protein